MSKHRQPSPWFIVTITAITLVVVSVLICGHVDASGVQTKKDAQEVISANKLLIAKISDCKILALNSRMPERVKNYDKKLAKFSDFYSEFKIFQSGVALGFLGGIVHQMGFTSPTRDQVKKVAIEMYFNHCEISF